MDFSSDNAAAADPRILDALAAANQGPAPSYDDDAISQRLAGRFREIFECDLEVLPVVSGTAANALSLAAMTPPYGAVLCHRESHIEADECGAPEFFTGGAKLALLEGAHGKIGAPALGQALEKAHFGFVHAAQPTILSVTQSTEAGTVYTPDELKELTSLTGKYDLRIHMDGARFANALVGRRATPADLSWKAGVDILCFGATKNGALAAEAIVLFRPGMATHLRYLRKRAGHLIAKTRFLAAQLEAYLDGDLWLDNARHANGMARRLADGLEAIDGVSLIHPVEANELFVGMPDDAADRLEAAGARFFRNWSTAPAPHHRFVTAFNTLQDDVDRVIATVRG
ncbi:MAG: low specificity L-threonine aldolase [Alphaproteobacteria bacterium]|nr:low specificity L-threonine aldolase [Alphaproteobacteria bacterium]